MIEMVVMIFMVAVLGGLVIANTRVGDNRQRIRDAAYQFVSAARQAQGNSTALLAVRQPDGVMTTRPSYGVCITSSQVPGATLDCDDPGVLPKDTFQIYARRTADTTFTNRPSTPEILATYRLPAGATITESGAPPSRQHWIDYVAPTASMFVCYSNPPTCQNAPPLVVGDASFRRTIVLRPTAGVLYVQ